MNTSRIIHVSAYYPPHLGGQEIAVHDLVAQLTLMGMKVEVVTSNLGARAGVSIENGVQVTRLKSSEFAHTATTWRLFPWLLRHVNRDTIVHLHVGQFFISEIVWLASKIKRFRYIMHIHCYPVESGPLGKLLPLYKKLFFRREIHSAKMVIVLNRQHHLIVRGDYKYAGRLLLTSNGIDESFFRVVRRPVDSETLRLLFVGRLSPGKNLDNLLEAIGAIGHGVELDIIGDGECRPKLETMIISKGLKNVKLHGRLNRDEIKEFYATSSALILPSFYEANPMVLLEAMASRIPIIVTKGIGMELEAWEAILIEPTVQGIVDGIENLRAMPLEARRLLTGAAFKRVEESRWNTLTQSYSQLYAETVEI